jgi:hypothetical protein
LEWILPVFWQNIAHDQSLFFGKSFLVQKFAFFKENFALAVYSIEKITAA